MSETLTVRYTDGYDAEDVSDAKWSNVSRAFDGNTSLFASCSIPKNKAGSSIFADELPTISDLGTITKVEMRIFHYVSNTSVRSVSRPHFGGSTPGTQHTKTFSSSDTDNDDYIDITSIENAPSTWTWNDVRNLVLEVWGNNTSDSTRVYYISLLGLRITYEESETDTKRNILLSYNF